MTQRPDTPLKDLAGTLRTLIRSNRAAADALVQIQEIEALAEDRLRPLLPELRVIKDDALAAARELDAAKLGELPFRLRDLVAGAGNGHRDATDAGSPDTPANGDQPDDIVAGHTSYPSDRILPLAVPDGPAAPPPPPLAPPALEAAADLNSPKRVAAALFHLHELRVAGVLDQPEYDAKKRELLDRL